MNVLFKVTIKKDEVDNYSDDDNVITTKTVFDVIHINSDGEFLVTQGKEFFTLSPWECLIHTKLQGALK